jgi:DNA-binding NarL/FixJ family response regulator
MQSGDFEELYMVNIFIVSDSHITRSGLRRILETQTAVRVLGELSVKRATAEVILDPRPDVVLVDLDSHGADVLGLIDALVEVTDAAAILVLSDLTDHELARKALSRGASGIALKMQPPAVLIAAIRELCPLSRKDSTPKSDPSKTLSSAKDKKVLQLADDTKDLSKIHNLTAREREIIWLIGQGLKNKEIARRLSISDITVRHHLTSIFCKLEVEDRQKLLILAHRYGLADLSVSSEPA